MSDTPRTDSEISRIKKATKSMDNDSAYFENYQCMRDFARELERELAAMTAERDRQAEFIACLRNDTGNIPNNLPEKRDWFDPTTERIACEYVQKGDVA